MRCAKLLAYLMIELEVPVVVRHAIRCARIFFFGLVDFEKLDLYQAGDWGKVLSKMAEPEEEQEQVEPKSSLTESNQEKVDTELSSCCQNNFILATLKKIGERISNSQKELDRSDGPTQEEAKSAELPKEQEPIDKPEASSLVEEEQIVSIVKEDQTESPRDN